MFENLCEQKPELKELKPVVIKELIHYEILWILDEKGFSDELTFHGGTALRLCFDSYRLSEDLDFAGGPDFSSKQVQRIAEILQKHLLIRYGLEVSVKEPKPQKKKELGVSVASWRISVSLNNLQKHLPQQRIKIYISTLKPRSRTVLPIQLNYPVLPSGVGDTILHVMSREEIMSNKLVSLPNSAYQNRIRLRDVWDISWLHRQRVKPNFEWISEKIAEYKINDFAKRVATIQKRLLEVETQDQFKEEMVKFLPPVSLNRTINRPEIIAYIIRTVYEQLGQLNAENLPLLKTRCLREPDEHSDDFDLTQY